ncbi:MAG: hypothetical protein ACO21X_06170 [Sediminibacterium sp.]
MKKSFLILLLFVAISSQAQHIRFQLNFPVGIYSRPQVRAPYANAIWVGPEWIWANNGYQPRSGYWAKPPRRGAKWMPGYWKPTRRGHIWIQGRWFF